MAHNQEIGRLGEELAAEYLVGLGWQILERNWRHRAGELDLICTYRGRLHFVEVKTRSSESYGHPFTAIEAQKLQRLHRLARSYLLAQMSLDGKLKLGDDYQIDAVAILLNRGSKPVVEICLDVA